MTALDLPAIRALHEGITPGEWFQGRHSVRHESVKEVYSEREPSRTSEDICTAWYPRDAAFIAAAPSIVAQLVAVVERVEGLVNNAYEGPTYVLPDGYPSRPVEAHDLRAAINLEGQ